jgi:NitT/TauT family transport system substrate-binding protein
MVMKVSRQIGICWALVGATLALPTTGRALDFGKVGEPVNLAVGYQPYYTQAWSGVVMNGTRLWEKYLPKGSTVEFQVGLQGAIIVNAMTGEKLHIGYAGDMPSIAATFRYLKERGGVDIRIVAVLGTSKQQCNIFMIRNDAPEFKNGREAVKWMDGKVTSSPHGSCTDRFGQLAFKLSNIQPARYLNQNIEVITTNFRAGKLDAAVIWEPTASKLVTEGIARRAASGEDFDALDGGMLIMLNDLIQQRPDIVRAWLEAELEAQLFIADPKNAVDVVKMAEQQTEKMPARALWASLYGAYPKEVGGGKIMNQFDFIISDRPRQLLDDATAFLYNIPQKPAAAPKIRPEAFADQIAREVLKARGLSSPIGAVKAQPLEANPFK